MRSASAPLLTRSRTQTKPKKPPVSLLLLAWRTKGDGLDEGPEMPKSSAKAYQKNHRVNQLPCDIAVPPGSWRRASAGKDGKIGRPEASPEQILRALVGAHLHRGRIWSPNDQATLEEVGHRSWRWLELQQRRFLAVPTWMSPAVAHPRFWPFLSIVIASYRAGAIGVLLSYEEGAAFFGVSRRTWARWIKALAEAGLVRVLPTWLESSSDGRGRDRGRNLYQVGPELERAAGPGLMEGLGEGATKRWRGRMAAAARRRAKRKRHDALTVAWAAQREVDAAEPGTAPEPAQEVSEGGAQDAVRTGAGSLGNSEGSATLAPHSPPGRASLGSDPVGEGEGPAVLEKDRALRARRRPSSGPHKHPRRPRGSSARTQDTHPRPADHELAPGHTDAAANDTAVAPGRGAAAVPPDEPPRGEHDVAAAVRETSAEYSRREPEPSPMPAGREAEPSPKAPRPPAPDEQLTLGELDSASAAKFFGSVRSTQTSFWRDLPRNTLETWGLASDRPKCAACSGSGETGSRWNRSRERIVRVVCDRCGGSGDEPEDP